jgi:hypothetical protein
MNYVSAGVGVSTGKFILPGKFYAARRTLRSTDPKSRAQFEIDCCEPHAKAKRRTQMRHRCLKAAASARLIISFSNRSRANH